MASIIGFGINQIPTNGMLGGLAFQDPNYASISLIQSSNAGTQNGNLILNPISGNIGIGTTATSTKLEVSGGVRISGITTVTNTTNASATNTGALQVAGGVGIGQDLRVGGTIFGNISGTVTGSASQVNTIQRTTNASHFLTFVDSDNASSTGEILYTTGSFVVNPSTGNIGIGNNNPSFRVDTNLGSVINNTSNFGYNITADATNQIGYAGYNVTLNNSSSNASGFIRLARTAGTVYLGMEIQSQSRDGIRFLTGSSSPVEVIRVDASGNVSIGTTSVTRKVNVFSTISNTEAFYVEKNITTGTLSSGVAKLVGQTYTGAGTTSNAYIEIVGQNGANSRIVTLGIGVPSTYGSHDVGFLSLGTSSMWNTQNGVWKWSTNNTATNLGVTYKGYEWYNNQSDNQNAFTFYHDVGGGSGSTLYIYSAKTSNTNTAVFSVGSAQGANFNIDNLGNVGISNSSPSTRLDVSGGTRITGVTTITNTTNSTSATSGALQVAGGVGIAGNINANGTAFQFGSFDNANNSPISFNISHYNNSTGATLRLGDAFTGRFTSLNHSNSTKATLTVGTDNNATGNGSAPFILNITNYINGNSVVRDLFEIRNGGSTRFYVDTNGRVGIGGITTPTTALDVSGGTNISGITTVTNTTNATSTNTGALQVSGGVGIGGNLYVGGEIVAQKLTIQLTTVTTTLIQTDDIIQTYNTSNATSTTTGALQVSGGAGIGRDLYVGGTIYGNISGAVTGSSTQVNTIQTTTNAAHYLTFVDSNNASSTGELLYTTSSLTVNPSTGNVGIGTTAPSQKLTINGPGFGAPQTSGTSQTYGAIRIIAPSTTGVLDIGIGASGTNQWIQSTDSGGLNNNYNLLLNPNGGNVGVGTSNPGFKLSVQDAINIIKDGSNNAVLYFNGTGTRISYNDNTGNLSFFTNSAERGFFHYNNGAFYLTGAGTASLPVISKSDDSNTGIFFPAADTIAFAEGGAEVLRIDSASNVGIGTTVTTTKLEIAGGIRASGITTVTNTTSAVSTTTGALQVSGGVSVADNLFVHGNVNVGTANTVSSVTVFNTTTSALNVRSIAKFTSPNNLNTVTVRMLDSDIITFSGSAGQLFSISDTFTGTIFAVNDISGVPSIEVYDTGLVSIAEFTGNVGIGTTSTTAKLTVNGGARISGVTTVTNNTNATSTITGALQVVGGVGIGQDLRVGGTIFGNISGTVSGSASQVNTIQRTANAAHYLTFVDSDNVSAAAESVYTTSSFTINPSSGAVSIGGPTVINVNSSSEALRITQTGNGDVLRVEDSTNPDSTPFRIGNDGVTIVGGIPVVGGGSTYPIFQVTGYGDGTIGANAAAIGINGFLPSGNGGYFAFNRSNNSTVGNNSTVSNGDEIGRIVWSGADGTNYIRSAQISAVVDGVPGTNDMPGRLVFSTTADGASTLSERMRITSGGNILIGRTYNANEAIGISFNSGASTSAGIYVDTTINSATTSRYDAFTTYPGTAAATFILPNLVHYRANQNIFGAGSTVTNQIGFLADGGLSGAINNFGFYSSIPGGTNRWNFYAASTATNYFAGDVGIGTLTPTSKLHVFGASGYQDIRLGSGSNNAFIGVDGVRSYIGTYQNIALSIQTNSTDRIRITNDGNVGIANTTPGARLHIGATNADSSGIILGTFSHYYRFIQVPAKTTVTATSETFSFYFGRTTNGLTKINLFAGGWNLEEGAQFEIHRDWGVNAVPKIKARYGSDISEITWHYTTSTTDLYDLHLSYTYPAGVPTGQSNYFRAEIVNNGQGYFNVAAGVTTSTTSTNLISTDFNITAAGSTLIPNTTNASSTTTGALQVVGGVGIGQDLRVGGTIFGNVSGTVTGSASQVNTIQRTTNAAHYLTFVDSDNASSTGELLYTTSSFVVNPSTGNIGLGVSSPATILDIFGTLRLRSTQFNWGELSHSSNGYIGTDASTGLRAGSGRFFGSGSPNNGYLQIDSYGSVLQAASIANSNSTVLELSVSQYSPTLPNYLKVLLSAPGTLNSTAATTFRGLQTVLTDNSTVSNTVVGLYSDVSAGTNTTATRYSAILLGGNVGISTSTPATRLHVDTSSTAADVIRVTNGTQNLNLGVNNGAGGSYLFEVSNNALRLGTNNAERVRIHANGNVSIGTTTDGGTLYVFGSSPGSGVNLRTRGDVVIDSSGSLFFDGNYAYATGNYIRPLSANTQAYFTAGAERLRITSTGNIGIGTTAPSTLLDVAGGVRITGITTITNSTSVSSTITGALQVVGGIGIGGGGFFGGTVTATNFVGNITGTVTGAATQVNTVQQTSTLTHFLTFVDSNNSSATAESVYTTSTFAIIPSSGNVGIGTSTPNAPLTVQGSGVLARFRTGSATDGRVEFAYNLTDIGYIAAPTSSTFEITARSNNALVFGSNATERMRIFSNGNIAINTTTDSSFRLEVNGSFAATTKSFVINHPTRPGKKLRYGSLEGPENGVYVRGKLTDSNIIELPEYWTKLVDPESITVNLTPIGRHQNLYVEDIVNNTIIVGNSNLLNKKINCYYTVFAERADVDKLQVEI